MKQLVLAWCGLAAGAAAHATPLNFDTFPAATCGDRVPVLGQVSVVPEAPPLAMLLAGLGLMGAWRVRRGAA